ncbi:hypothetical protein ACFY30_27220 [Streptomyces sp. NPDC000345]|uniref:hypothetical protein n=1 Tax=Streptomyces sp. NPDC000345 TaxID=3364537 RepID=UPI00369976D8
MYQTVVAGELLPGVGDCVGVGTGAGAEDAADTVGVGRGTPVAVSARWGDRVGVADGVGADAVRGTPEDGEVGDVLRPADAWPPGRVGCPAVAVGRESGVSVGEGRVVAVVSGAAVREGSGSSVGREMSPEAEGAGRGLPSFDAVSAQTPRPPNARTAAAPTIHGDLRGGRR